jgi:riboflavin synthase
MNLAYDVKMFTGIITHRSVILSALRRKNGLRVTLRKPASFRARAGDSVSVNGICSTAVHTSKNSIEFDYMPETLSKTNVREWRRGTPVNLEASLTLQTLLSGHLVTGHVDAVGKVQKISHGGSSETFTIDLSPTLMRYIAPKGSVTIDGISLTVVQKMHNSFSISLIPYTLRVTNLGMKRVGDSVNIETDILAKYLGEMLISKKRNHAKKRT